MAAACKATHLASESKSPKKTVALPSAEVDTFAGKVHVEWDNEAAVTPLGQLPFFIEFLKTGGRLMPWVNDCPLHYLSNNSPAKIDLLGSLLLSILSGHRRYAHITALSSDRVNTKLLGMNKIVSDDSARRGLKKIDEADGVNWLQEHLYSCYEPLLETPWILDTDVTIKTLYGKQEGAEIGYNPKKPGRPSHTYHTYLIANLRLVLDVEVQPGNVAQSSHSLPGLLSLLKRLPENNKPEFIRGDCDWGNDHVMSSLEAENYSYLFKLKKSKNVKKLIYKHHSDNEWRHFKEGFEATDDYLKLQSWDEERRVVIVRKRLARPNAIIGIECEQDGQQQLAFIDGPEALKTFEYAVLVTNLEEDLISIVQHYRDRADCENVFDEIKNQWGWGGFTTKDIKSCRFIARIIALIYNWWTLFVRLANPDSHLEAITSRPLLLTSIGRLTESGRQKRMYITSHHGNVKKRSAAYWRVTQFFKALKTIAPQLTPRECWTRILVKAMEAFHLILESHSRKALLQPT